MKLIPKSFVTRSILAIVLIGLLALGGPSLIHLVYRVVTPASTRPAQAVRYQSLADAEVSDQSLSQDQLTKMRHDRLELFYWFHSRGWDIDEGDEEQSWLDPWRELIRYWTL